MGDTAGAGDGVSDAEASAFAQSQESIGLGTLGLTAGELSGVTASGVAAAQSGEGNIMGGPSGGTAEPRRVEEAQVPEPVESAKPRTGGGTQARRRRRSLLLQEEGGFLSPLAQAPVKKRSLFAG